MTARSAQLEKREIFMCHEAKRNLLLCAVIVVTLLFGLVLPAPVSAEIVVNIRQPFSAVFFDDCSGEDIQVIAEDHVLIRQRVGDDGVVYWDEFINTHGTAVGLVSGRLYVYNETIRFSRPAEPGPECGFTTDFSTRLRFVSNGSDDNFFVRYSFHLEVSPKCEVTLEETFQPNCNG